LQTAIDSAGSLPAIPMHAAGTVDALNLLQDYLDKASYYSRQGFHDFLLNNVKNYNGLMGSYSFDENGNADSGFTPYKIKIENHVVMEQPVP